MRRFLFLVTIVGVITIVAAGAASGGVSGARAVPVLPGSRTAAGATLSVSSQLDVRRSAASGDRAYELGLNDEPGDIDETAKFPDAVAMVWRWTGDNAFRDQMYAFTKKNMQYMLSLISGDDPWPSGAANVESDVLGPDAVDAAARHHDSSYTTTVTASVACTLHVGATVPAGATVHQVTLNGSAAHYAVRDTNAGREVMVSTPCRGQTWQVHVVAG